MPSRTYFWLQPGPATSSLLWWPWPQPTAETEALAQPPKGPLSGCRGHGAGSWTLGVRAEGGRGQGGLRGLCGSCSPKDAPEATVLLEKENRLHLRSGRRVASDGPQGDTYMHTHTHTTHCRGDKC